MFNTDPDFRAYVDAERAANLRAVIIVHDVMPYAYTIGNACYGAPELLLIGTADEGVRDLLHRVSRMMPKAPASPFSIRPHAKGGPTLRIVDAAVDKAVAALHSLRLQEYHLAAPFRLMQVLLPDPAGRYPGERGCADPYSRVPVIGA